MLVVSLVATPAAAETLTVDLSSPVRPVTHVASGSLYGMIETLPADLDGLVAPLAPNMFTNPAANIQQPWGDAIEVAERLAPLGGTVTIRLADLWTGWPYQFTNMTEWFELLEETTTRKIASGLDNFYGYEIWNEPDGTFDGRHAITFYELWDQTYDELLQLDPDAVIIGPGDADYDENRMRAFLTFARDSGSLPDIVAWHQLVGQNLAADYQSYRELEQELGIGPLPISINEYSGSEWIDDEGQPGASAPIIAKLERFDIDTACISYWDVAHAGRLGSLLASDTEPNGGWWFYKWYGDMRGVMVATTPDSPSDTTTVDGFANLDADGCSASVLLAGENDGTIEVVIEGFSGAGIFGAAATVTVERTPWVNRTTPVSATETLFSTEMPIQDDSIQVSIPSASDVDGYRILLEPTGDVVCPAPGSGGTGGSGGGEGTASGGAAASGGSMAANGGTVGGGGQPAAGGTVGSGGASNPGVGGHGAGGQGAGGQGVSGGADGAGAAGVDAGCGCRVAANRHASRWVDLAGLALLIGLGGRRRRAPSPTRLAR